MKIAIISAMEKEREMMLSMMREPTEIEVERLRIQSGKIGSYDVWLSQCGIGKVNAAINTYKIIQAFQPDLVINTGVAGGTSLRTEIGDVLVADFVAYHDVWCGPGTQPGVADGMDVFLQCDRKIVDLSYELFGGKRLQVGLICSGDRFISERQEVDDILSIFPEAIAVDMESAAIAHVCTMENTPYNIIRVISDTPGSGRNWEQYKNFWKEAPEKNFLLIESVLNHL